MDTSKSIVSNLELNAVKTDRLFYDRYRWGLAFNLAGLHCMRYLQFDRAPDRDEIAQRWDRRRGGMFVRHGLVKNVGGNWAENTNIQQFENLISFVDELVHFHPCIKLVISYDHGYLYSNEFDVLQHFASLPYLAAGYCKLREAVIVKPRDSVCLRETKHKYRSFFREKTIEPQDHERLKSFLGSQQNIRLGPALKYWLDHSSATHHVRSRRYTQPHWFFDHNNDGELLLLEMISPKIIRRTMPIIKVNN